MESAELPARFSTTQRVRDLWVLREQAKVRATEFRFLRQLENILNQHVLRVYVAREKDSYIPKNPTFGDTDLDRKEESRSIGDSPLETNNTTPIRERNCRGSSVAEVQQIQQSRPVTRLSAEYRSLLEGASSSPPRQSWFGGDLWRQVVEQQAVSNVLNSSFRHRLEFILLHSPPLHSSSNQRTLPSYDDSADRTRHHEERTTGWEDLSDLQSAMEDIETSEVNHEPSPLEHMEKLQAEIQWIKSTMQASFDLQLEMQREIRQEIAALLHEHSTTSNTSFAIPSKPISKGTCIVCAQNSIDALLYSCGHMCTCCYCGRQLIATGKTCPICRAPVKDVVRAYTCEEC